jgi:hypothetical protein
VEQSVEEDPSLPAAVDVPPIPLTIEDVTYTSLAAIRGPIEGELVIEVAVELPASEPDFAVGSVAGWLVNLNPRERVILADGTPRPSALADRNIPLVFPVHSVEATPAATDPLVIGTPPSPTPGPRTQRLTVTTRFCKNLRQSDDPRNLERHRSDCVAFPIALASPCSESVGVRVHFDNGYSGELAVTPSAPVTLVRSAGAGCGAPDGFTIRPGTMYRVDPDGEIDRLTLPVAHGVFPGYHADGVSRFYLRIDDPADPGRSACTLIPSLPIVSKIPMPVDADLVLVAGFRAGAGGPTAAQCLPCNQRRTISVWHEFLNVTDSLRQTATVDFTRTSGRDCDPTTR